MTRKAAGDVQGLEYDWLASNVAGNIAFFSTACGGYAPEGFLADTDVFDAAIESIVGLPVTTAARFAPTLSGGQTNTWKLMAERGVFAFDADSNGGPYHLVASPEVAARVADFPAGLAPVLFRVVLRGFSIAQQTALTNETLMAATKTVSTT